MPTPQYGIDKDRVNSRVAINYAGTRFLSGTAAGVDIPGTLAVTGASTLTGLLTASAAATVTTGNLTTTAGDNRVTAGNVRLGVVSAFGTTEPTSWVVCKSGTQPAGAITTSGGIGSDATTVQKIIAAGTINNVET